MTGRTPRAILLRSTTPDPQYPHWRHHPLVVDTAAGRKELGDLQEDGTSTLYAAAGIRKQWTPAPEEEDAACVGRGPRTTNIKYSMERCRRGKMNEKYATLQSMVPNLFPKAPKARIVEETINYIGELEETIRALEAAKESTRKRAAGRMRSAASTSSVDVTISGKMAFFGVRSTWRPGLAAHALQVFDKHQALQVLSATVSYDGAAGSHNNNNNNNMDSSSSSNQNDVMSLSITAMADETSAVVLEAAEEELMAMLSS